MINMSASIETNVSQIASKLKATPAQIKAGIIEGLDEAADLGVRQMKTAHKPFSKRGKTLKSIQKIPTGEFSRTIGPMSDELVPLFLEKGTKAHIIMGKPYLAFEGSSKGKNGKKTKNKVILGWKLKNGTRPGIVHHPGTTPRPFVQPAYDMLKVMFPKIIATHVKNAIK